MKYLTEAWQPSNDLCEQIKEVNHNEETKYFKYFNIRNQVRRDNWDNEYKKWCAKSKARRCSTNTARRNDTKPSNDKNSFFSRVYSAMQNR